MANKRKSSRKLALWMRLGGGAKLTTNLIFFAERLTPLAFSTQSKLLSVNLTNNLIYDIQKGAFTGMTRMVRLILTRNKISRIDDNVLSGKTFWHSTILLAWFLSLVWLPLRSAQFRNA